MRSSCGGPPSGGIELPVLEPVDGQCPSGGLQQNPVDLPLTEGPGGPVEGWRVYVPPGALSDPLAPTGQDLDVLAARCVAACEAQWTGNAAISANCADPDAFGVPEHLHDDAVGPEDLILAAQKGGEGGFPGQSLPCELSASCFTAFDEELSVAIAQRATPAGDPLGVGEEFLVTLGPPSKVQIDAGKGTHSAELTGSVGYSFCRDGSASAPCPFYVGTFEAHAESSMEISMKCADKSTASVEVSNLAVRLSQPAFGIAAKGGQTTSKGFPRGSLIFETSVEVGGVPVATRRPSQDEVIVSASGTKFKAIDMTVILDVPCNDSTAKVTVTFTAHSKSGDGGPLGRPPGVKNTTAATGPCGVARTLTATVSDPDGDVDALRWRVDGVLTAPDTTNMIVTMAHTVEAIGRDARGATTTSTKKVSCN